MANLTPSVAQALTTEPAWHPGPVPVAVVMISLNEGHNMEEVLRNLAGWAQQVFLVDSYSADETVDIALRHGVHVVQRRFRGFGDQWNFALRELPITSPWTMKLDPDERLTPELKWSIESALRRGDLGAGVITRRLWFMGRPLPVCQRLVRIWRTGACRFTDVLVNEYPIVDGPEQALGGELEHHDSPSLTHWYDKQNRYSAAEALIRFEGRDLSDRPSLLGSGLQRRMWVKKHFWKLPGRYVFFASLPSARRRCMARGARRLDLDPLAHRDLPDAGLQGLRNEPPGTRVECASLAPRVTGHEVRQYD
ncbi:MAG: glycosyl transferase family 2 [Armatimonadetes bacterium OLB18]|nr:MAG: glycosyl transferase family 2 [Armatimonadetes bacterium OLB18]